MPDPDPFFSSLALSPHQTLDYVFPKILLQRVKLDVKSVLGAGAPFVSKPRRQSLASVSLSLLSD